jgi:hypothetical protein
MQILIDNDYICSLLNIDTEQAETILNILRDNHDNLLDKIDDAIMHILYTSSGGQS